MSEKNKSQKFAKRLLSILGENHWREARWILLLILMVGIFFSAKYFFKN